MARHLLTLRDLAAEEIGSLLDEAQAVAEGDIPALDGAVVATLFYEPSTRTEMSFERAARRAGAEVLHCNVEHSSVRKGESLVDTVRTFAALGTDVLVLRHPASGAPALAARHMPCAVVNAGDGMHEHPTQGLLDLLTVRQLKGRIAGLRVAVVGDIVHSRVARSTAWGFSRLGASVVLVGPATLLPVAAPVPGVEMTVSLETALSGADVVLVLRLQRERQAAGDVPSSAEYSRLYGVSEPALQRSRPDVVVLHPGPANVGVEITAEVAYGPRSAILRQVENGVYVRMAVLRWALAPRTVRHSDAAKPRRSPQGQHVAPVAG